MSPKPPARPKVPNPPDANAHAGRDSTPNLAPRLPADLPDVQLGPAPQPLRPDTHPPVHEPSAAFEIIDLPRDLRVSRVTVLPISAYMISPRFVERLPAPDSHTGLRSLDSGRQYADLLEGTTVHVGKDAQGLYRAKLLTELLPSGPRLERLEGTTKWRRLDRANPGTSDSELSLTQIPDDSPPRPGPSKRPRLEDEIQSAPKPWADWRIADHFASPTDITIAGVRYKALPSGNAPDHPIVYIKNPSHLVYDFDLMENTLLHNPEQQPRGAIQVPPTQRWEIDANLPFEKTFTGYVANYFPELSEVSLRNVAREQFRRANGGDSATNVGLTTLRQVFNDWKMMQIAPRPDLADPLLMLPIMPFFRGEGAARRVEATYLANPSALHRLEFAPQKFRKEWHYFTSTQTGIELKRFMACLLVRNGYSVFDPTAAASYPALVFTRPGHDFVFHMTLHRVRGNNIPVPSAGDRTFSSSQLPQQVGGPATQAVLSAHAAGKLVHLKGGSQTWKGYPDVAFIVRTNDPGA